MYLKDNAATTFNIWQNDHTKFKVPGPPVYKGSDSQMTPSPVTDDTIPCNCDGGELTAPGTSVAPEAPAAPAPSVTPPVTPKPADQNPPSAGSGGIAVLPLLVASRMRS
jgi:hypothetical protein